MERDSERATGLPRWVKVLLIVVAIMVLLFVTVRLLGIGGQHGPQRHSGEVRTSGVITEHTSPPGGHG
jgi:hypothetical protein